MGRLLLQHIRRILPLKQMVLLFILMVFSVTAGTAAFASASREFVIHDGGGVTTVQTLGIDVQQALNQLDVDVGIHDYTSMTLDQKLSADAANILEIRRAVPLSLTVDGERKDILSWRETVGEVLKEQGITLGALDRLVDASMESKVESGMDLQLVRVRVENLSEFADIPYDVVEQTDKTLNEGQTRIAQEGVDGKTESVYRILYEDGKPVSRTFLNERVVSNPIERIVMIGTVKNFMSHRGDVVRYSKTLDLKATAYTASFADTGKHPGTPGFGITRTGIRAREGVIAVDPRIIPLGTKVYVEVPGSAPDYGFAIAADIGSAIKGKLIDLYFDTTLQAKNWGRRNVRVYILNEQNDTRWKQNDSPCTK